jgi:hypothetical protein
MLQVGATGIEEEECNIRLPFLSLMIYSLRKHMVKLVKLSLCLTN